MWLRILTGAGLAAAGFMLGHRLGRRDAARSPEPARGTAAEQPASAHREMPSATSGTMPIEAPDPPPLPHQD